MSVRGSLLSFFRDPKAFANDVQPDNQRLWLEGLTWANAIIEERHGRALRKAQVVAWTESAASRVSLILGPPGTGKTFALSWMIAGYVEASRRAGKPCRVFVSGFTTAAITNALSEVAKRVESFCDEKPPIAFMTSARSKELDPRLVQFEVPADSAAFLTENTHVVCGGTVWQMFKLQRDASKELDGDGTTAPVFDLVCIDEASQMVVGHGLMALAGLNTGGRIIVAGDNKQLGPIRAVTSEQQDDERALGGSMYDFLHTAGVPEFALDETFRLNRPLAHFPAERFYDGGYVAAEPEKQLALPEGWRDRIFKGWIRAALDPKFPVFIVLHDGPGTGTASPFEADLVGDLAHGLFTALHPDLKGKERTDALAQYWKDELAVISPHRAQNALIREVLDHEGVGTDAVVETVDRIQGRERDAIIASYTVGDPEFALAEADFIFDPARLNVTITRARTKLIVLVHRRLLEAIPADEETFQRAQLLREFVFASKEFATLSIPTKIGTHVDVTLRVRRFSSAEPMPDLEPDIAAPVVALAPLPEFTADHQKVLDCIKDLVVKAAPRRAVFENDVRKALATPDAKLKHLVRDLFVSGLVSGAS